MGCFMYCKQTQRHCLGIFRNSSKKETRPGSEKNWALADQIRDALVARSVVVRDGKI